MTDFSRPVDEVVVIVPPEHAGQRIDSYLPRRFNWRSRNYFFGLLSEGSITVNGTRVKKSYKVREGDSIEVALPESYRTQFDYDSIPLSIIHEDRHIVAIDKAGNLAVQPTGRYIHENLLYRLRHHYRQFEGDDESGSAPCIVHRLDRETSGVIVFAKSPLDARNIAGQFASKTTRKIYTAVVHAHPPETGTIDAPLLATKDRHVVVDNAGKHALTRYRRLGVHGPFAVVELELLTGRQHQLRVHLASIGHPIVSDEIYGNLNDRKNPTYPTRHLLHATRLTLKSPERGELTLHAPIPNDFTEFLSTQTPHNGHNRT